MKYLFGYFYRNSLDYLRISIQSFQLFRERMVIIDNTPDLSLRYEAPFPEGVRIIEPPIPLTFTQSMNYLIRMAEEEGCDAIMFTHNDVEAHLHTPERIVAALDVLQKQNINWGIMTAHGFLFAVLNLEAVRKVGMWDTVFPSNFSDYDYCQRMHLGGFKLVETYFPLTHHNGGSSTLRNDIPLWNLTAMNSPMWRDYYAAKWGGIEVHEKYRIPFDPGSTNPPPTSWATAVISFDQIENGGGETA